MTAFLIDLAKMLGVFALSVFTLEALVILIGFVYWYIRYRMGGTHGPHS